MLKAFGYLFGTLLLLALMGAAGSLFVFYKYGRDLPDYKQLATYEPPLMTRVHASDGRLLAEYARERRLFVPISAFPPLVIKAFLSAEDKNFYSHAGIDFLGVLRALVTNIRNYGSERRLVGASTITQQVAKNFLLTNELTLNRKVREAILAFRMERTLSKDRILELYLNQIYLGLGSYGVAAAALNYFNKALNELTLAEAAYLAALPKAPNNYHPIHNYAAAVARRNWVLDRMVEDRAVDMRDAEAARIAPLVIGQREKTEFVSADYFAEEVRRELYQMYGESGLYEGGLSVRTTLEPRLQDIAERALRKGLVAFDRRHGWRGPVAQIDTGPNWESRLAAVAKPPELGAWQLAVVLETGRGAAIMGLADGSTGRLPLAEMTWARKALEDQGLGGRVRRPSDVVKPGDVVAVEAIRGDIETATARGLALRQTPLIDGGIVAIDPHTGRVLAMVGGYSYRKSQFNRVTQARRQPGSAFKPFVYSTALDAGFTPSSLILDEPFVIDQGPGQGKWRPANFSRKFYGPSTLRLGIEKSRNLMTVRLANHIGMERIADYAERFGVVDYLPRLLSMALGAGETTLMRMTAAYAIFVNGGKRITPTLIDRIQDRRGRTIFRHDQRPCLGCAAGTWRGQPPPLIPDARPQVLDRGTAYQIVSLLEGVVQRGTGVRVRAVGRPIAGKTGTTNDERDTWFIGFTPDLVVGVFAGFDAPSSLGKGEQGATVAAPIFIDFMKEALARDPAIPFRIPPGIRLVRVNARTGQLAQPGDPRVILEAFKPGTEPRGEQVVLDGSGGLVSTAQSPKSGTGSLY